jgi:hypothetical protein
MAKLKNPLFSLEASGRVAKHLAARRLVGHGQLIQTTYPKDARTSEQLSWRTMYQLAITLWHALSASDKKTWESVATPHHMTGFAYFMSQALRPNPGIYLPLAGGTMTGDIAMASHKITALPAPTADEEPSRKLDLTTHEALTTGVHGAGASTLETIAGSASKVTTHAALTTGVHLFDKSCRLQRTTAQSIPTGTPTQVLFPAELWDTDNMHSTSVSTHLIACTAAGKYIIIALVEFAYHATGNRQLYIYKNLSQLQAYAIVPVTTTGYNTLLHTSSVVTLAVGDTINISVVQMSGGNLNILSNTPYSPQLSATRLA